MNLFGRITLLLVTLISFTSCNPLRDFSINNPREITFDINNIKDGDFTIERNKSTAPVYHFMPKPGKTVVQIRIQGTLVWAKFDTSYVSDIWVYSDINKNLSYAIGVIDESGKRNLINYLNLEKAVQDVGIIDFINYRYDFYINLNTFSKFDLNSVFDYRFHKAKIYVSHNGSGKLVMVEPDKNDYFGELYEGKTLVYKAKGSELVKKIVVSLKRGKKSLMKITLDSLLNGELNFKYQNGGWININPFEYIDMYAKEIRMPSCEELINKDHYDNDTIDLFDITGHRLSRETSLNLLNVPTIRVDMDKLKKIKIGRNSIGFFNPNDVKVYLFRGVSSYEMIEVVSHFYVNKITRQFCLPKNPLKKSVRNVNYYYIKENNQWIRTNQSKFLKRFKILAKVNLIGEINRLTEADKVKNKSRIEIIKFACSQLDNIKLLPDFKTFETDIRDQTLLKDGILKLNIPKTPESKPEPKPVESSDSKPETKLKESSDPKPGSKPSESSDSKPESKSENPEITPVKMDSNPSNKTNEQRPELVSDEKVKKDQQGSQSVSDRTDKKDKGDYTDETHFAEGSENIEVIDSPDKKEGPKPGNTEDLPLRVDIYRSNSSDEHTNNDLDISEYESTVDLRDKDKFSSDNSDPKLRKESDDSLPKKKSGFISYSMLLTSLLFIISI